MTTERQGPFIPFDTLLELFRIRATSPDFFKETKEFSFPVVESVKDALETRILVVSPHQDDEVLGCGGTILRHTDAGADVKVVYMTDGGLGSMDDNTGSKLTKRRNKEAIEGLRIMGCGEPIFLENPDMGLNCSKKNVANLLAILNEYKPHKIFLPFFIENHPDHIATGGIVAHAIGRYTQAIECYCYEVWSPLYPNVLIDITAVMERKMEALNKHVSQLAFIDYRDRIRGLNAYRSITAGQAKYCEAFIKTSRPEFIQMAEAMGVL